MISLINAMVRGSDVRASFSRARCLWQAIRESEDIADVQRLARRVCDDQRAYEAQFGREGFVLVGITQWFAMPELWDLYSTEECGVLARRVFDAFRASDCDPEVRSIAEDVAITYDVIRPKERISQNEGFYREYGPRVSAPVLRLVGQGGR